MISDAMLTRVTRDISDGLIILDMHGSISFINPSAGELLEIDNIKEKTNYAEVMEEDIKAENDDFLQFLINAVYERDKTHSGVIKYITRKGNTKWLRMTTSFLFGEDRAEKEGVLVQFADITEIHELEQKTRDSASVFVVMMAAVCIWTFAYLIWMQLGQPISSSALTKAIEIVGFVIFFILIKKTSITISDMGLSFKGIGKYIAVDSVFTLLAAAVMIGIKLALLKSNPGLFAKNAVFNLDKVGWSTYIYPITVVAQEFLSRGVIHESIKRIMPGKSADFWAILVSSLFFGAMHLHKGLVFMIGAVILLSVFGLIYRKQRTIWGLCIPHYVLGTLLTLLFDFV